MGLDQEVDDVAAGRHTISPDIYGMNFTPDDLATQLKIPLNRWGMHNQAGMMYVLEQERELVHQARKRHKLLLTAQHYLQQYGEQPCRFDAVVMSFGALHLAASRGFDNLCRLLLARGADREARTEDGKTAAEIARERGHLGTAALLELPQP